MTAARFLILFEKMNLFRSYLKKQNKNKGEKININKWKILWSIWKWKKWNLLLAFMALVWELRWIWRDNGRHIWGFCSDQLIIEPRSLKKPNVKFPWVETCTGSENPSTSAGLLVTSRVWQVYRHGIQHDLETWFGNFLNIRIRFSLQKVKGEYFILSDYFNFYF